MSLGVSADAVSKWERGVICPNLEQLKGLCEILRIPASKLYFGITDAQQTELSVRIRRKKPIPMFIFFAALLFCAGAVTLSSMIWNGAGRERVVYTVSVDGIKYDVEENTWFSPQIEERKGYDYVGVQDSNGEFISFPQKITGDVIYTVIYRAHEYTVDYWLNGGRFMGEVQTVFTAESGEIVLAAPSKSGTTFEGWFMTPDYSGTAIIRLSCIYEDVVLYAKWSDNVYTVRYALGGGTLAENNPEQITESEEITLCEPVRTEYDFLGWFDAPTGEERYGSVGGKDAKNLYLYARWQKNDNRYTVGYELNGGRLTEENPTLIGAGEIYVLNSPEKRGYNFVCWNTFPDGSGEVYTSLYGLEDDLILYAVYTSKVYTVIYELNGGCYLDGANEDRIKYSQTVVLRPLTKYGYSFDGWYDAETGGKKIERIDESNILTVGKLYARFIPNSYRIELDAGEGQFELNGSLYGEGAVTLTFEEEMILPECICEGYDFVGWRNADGNYVERIDKLNIDDMSLTAVYRKTGLTYTVEYVLNGGEQNPENPQLVAYGKIIELKAPSKKGYLFLGWNDRSDGTGMYHDQTQADREEDWTLYAIWQEIIVSGSADNFNYEKRANSVAVTGYTGPFGENVDIVIPSYIDGLPVTEISGALNSFSDPISTKQLNSLTLPKNLISMGDYALTYLHIREQLVIPASVETIGQNCFNCGSIALRFEEGSKLKTVGPYAFANVSFTQPLQLPYGVENIEEHAFDGADFWEGPLILPESVKYIGYLSLSIRSRTNMICEKIYLPSSVEYIDNYAFSNKSELIYCVYTPLGEDVRRNFPENWDFGVYKIYSTEEVSGITLKDGGRVEFLPGKLFLLPTPREEGAHFIGWKEVGGDFVSQYYIPLREGVVLEAVYEADSPQDGRDGSSPYLMTKGEHEIILRSQESFYFILSDEVKRFKISWTVEPLDDPGDKSHVFALSKLNGEEVMPDTVISCEDGNVFKITGREKHWCLYQLRISLEVIDF